MLAGQQPGPVQAVVDDRGHYDVGLGGAGGLGAGDVLGRAGGRLPLPGAFRGRVSVYGANSVERVPRFSAKRASVS